MFRMALQGKAATIDEYHHFFTRRNIWDLLVKPTFILPIGGIVVGSILFFMFGSRPRPVRVMKKLSSSTHHDMSEGLILKFIKDPVTFRQFIIKYMNDLKRMYPAKEHEFAEIDLQLSATDFNNKEENLLVISKILNKHKKLIQEKRGSTLL